MAAWGLERFEDFVWFFREGLRVLLKHFIKRFWEGVFIFFWSY